MEKPGTSVVVDPDKIKEEKIPEYDRLAKARDPSAAAVTHEESSTLAKEVLSRARADRLDVYADATGDGPPGKFSKKVSEYVDLGYETHIVLVDIPTNMAIQRALERGDGNEEKEGNGRFVPTPVIRGIHGGVAANFLEWATNPDVSYEILWNGVGEGEPLIPIARKEKGAETPEIIDATLLAEFVAKAVDTPPPEEPEE